MKKFCLFLTASLFAFISYAADVPLKDYAAEQCAQSLFEELRCPVCEGQTIADSGAPLAEEMRAEVRRRVNSGEDEAAIKTYFTSRYGEVILQKPASRGMNSLLWLAPAWLLVLGGFLLYRNFKGYGASDGSRTRDL